MVRWLFANHHCSTILDPAVGTGVFLRSILESRNHFHSFTGSDIDPNILNSCEESIAGSIAPGDIKLHNKDYLLNNSSKKFDGIICNPPFINFRDYDNRDSLIKSVNRHTGRNLSRFSNIHGLFLAKTLSEMKINGRMAFILPSEFLNSNYGREIKEMIIDSGHLRYICLFDTNEVLFDGAVTTACILLFSSDNYKKGIEFINIGNLHDLQKAGKAIDRYPDVPAIGYQYHIKDLDPSLKWRRYYKKSSSGFGSNLAPLSKYCRILRGIATGANDYFTFDSSKIRETGIDRHYLVPCITRSSHVSDPIFTDYHLRRSIEEDKRIFLLDVGDCCDAKLQAYLNRGISLGVDKRYLPAHRKCWHAQENRPPAPIWAGTFSRKNIRFIRNEAGIKNLTAFHGIYLKPEYEEYTDVLFCWLLTETAKKILAGNRREYGNGLNKYEPGDLQDSYVIDLEALTEEDIKNARALYGRLKDNILSKHDYKGIIEDLENIFSNYHCCPG
jgi:adenine-specific DNA-methyltransferase